MQNDWAKWLSEVEFVINNASSLITLTSFFLINLSQNLCLNFEFFESLLKNFTSQAWDKLINVKKFIKKMKKLTEHLHDEMLIVQIIYKFNVNFFHRSCFKYFVEDEVWLNACNLNIIHLIIKLNDHNVDLFKIKHVFKNNFLIIELNLSTFIKIHLIFHVILLNHITSDFLLSQHQKSLDWSWWVKSLRSSRVLDSSRLDSSQNSWLEYSSQIEMFNLSIWVESENWNRVLIRNFRLDSSRHEDK